MSRINARLTREPYQTDGSSAVTKELTAVRPKLYAISNKLVCHER